HELHSEPYPFHYDLTIHGQENIRLSGRGLEAQLAGDLHLTGKNLTVSAIGSLQTTKGQFSFAGKDFNITQGEITFSESQTFLNITSNLDMPDLKVTVIFRGALTSPELIFQSNPPLPTGALLARILFNKDVSELTASQALQLADTVLTLSGGAGPNVMETIRKNLGIDRLSISASEETGKVSVQIGKKVAKGVMITLNQSTETSHILVEVELKGGFVLSAETQEDDQGKFTFKWNKNY
ncbi:MAG TPA: translocation/assembly module TamB domain-containing protein, partial [Rhabdochlamydiaceae bacterium]|nr:translocation/assembly module TamB domain-containing protein [Rhabdochlamydiaceae bacterium]